MTIWLSGRFIYQRPPSFFFLLLLLFSLNPVKEERRRIGITWFVSIVASGEGGEIDGEWGNSGELETQKLTGTKKEREEERRERRGKEGRKKKEKGKGNRRPSLSRSCISGGSRQAKGPKRRGREEKWEMSQCFIFPKKKQKTGDEKKTLKKNEI